MASGGLRRRRRALRTQGGRRAGSRGDGLRSAGIRRRGVHPQPFSGRARDRLQEPPARGPRARRGRQQPDLQRGHGRPGSGRRARDGPPDRARDRCAPARDPGGVDRRHRLASADGQTPPRDPQGGGRTLARRLAPRRARHHDDRHRVQAGGAPAAGRKSGRDRQGGRDVHARHGDHAGVPGDRPGGRTGFPAREPARGGRNDVQRPDDRRRDEHQRQRGDLRQRRRGEPARGGRARAGLANFGTRSTTSAPNWPRSWRWTARGSGSWPTSG